MHRAQVRMWPVLLALLVLSACVGTRVQAQTVFTADAKINVRSVISVNNTTAVAIKTTPGAMYSVEAFSNNITLAYIKLYNTLVTCGSATPPLARYMISFGVTSSGGGFTASNINGDAYFDGIYMCITTGIADSDTGAPAAGAYIVNVHYK